MDPSPVTKPHFPILDGLRGVAAILVVIFHLFEAHTQDFSIHPIHHGYLAVDFFFLLSGFVVGYAYDDRWDRMSVWDFFKIRLIRLHPLVILSVIIGVICFWFDPYTDGRHQVSLMKLIGVMLLSFTLLPTPDVRGWGETHSLVGPSWSLFQEYIANIIYALFARKMTQTALWILVILSGAALTAVAVHRGNVATGWGYDTFGIAVARMMFPFFGGLLLFRTGHIIRLPWAFTICTVLLLALFLMPYSAYNGWYESACILLGFPIIVAIGAGGQVKGAIKKVSDFFGDISYPIYITHYPIIYIYTAWIAKEKPAAQQFVPIAIASFFLMLLIAYASFKLYDLPVRKWLKQSVPIDR